MGKGFIEKFHIIKLKNHTTITVFEVVRNKFVWLEVNVKSDFRGKRLSQSGIKKTLNMLPGKHYLDFNPQFSIFSKVAKEIRWKKKGKSEWFEDCISYTCLVNKKLYKLPEELRLHKVTTRCPNLISFYKQTELNISLVEIRQSFV